MKFSEQSALTLKDFLKMGMARTEPRERAEEYMAADPPDRKTLERLLQSQLQPTLNLAIRLTGSKDQADELVGETMLRAVKGLNSFRGTSEFKTWLYRILVNTYRDNLKKNERVTTQSIEDVHVAVHHCVGAKMSTDELNDVIRGFIANLPTRQKEVLILSSFERMCPEDIGQTLGISTPNVYANLSCARKKLRIQLAPYFN